MSSDTTPPGATNDDDVRRQLAEVKTLLAAEMADRAQAEQARMRLLRRLVVAQEEERRRIASDLHDELGQRITALRLSLDVLEGTCTSPPQSAAVANAQKMVERIDQALDFIAWELKPAAIDEVDLVGALRAYVEEWSMHTGIPAAFHARPEELGRFTPEVEASVYRITQEALNNVAKHAAARAVHVRLELRGEDIALVVEDDGIGFAPAAPRETMIGVIGMRERALTVGGTLEIEPTPNGGTTVLARIPTVLSPPRSQSAGAIAATPLGGALKAGSQGSAEAVALTSIRVRLEELQRAVAARDEFIATVAHELRNPIAPLTFQLRLAITKTEQMALAGKPVTVEWTQTQLRGFEQRLHRLLETLDRLLDLSRLSTGRIDLQFETVNLGEVVREVVGALDAELTMARCRLTLSEHGDSTGTWDRLRVEQICRNLLSNAIRFGAGRPIDVAVVGARDHATLSVRDHGIGIAREHQTTIFERMERGEQRSGGFGIGLWIARTICAAMGGTISVTSEVGQGACFTVTLPIKHVA